jgi:hypothetical protein
MATLPEVLLVEILSPKIRWVEAFGYAHVRLRSNGHYLISSYLGLYVRKTETIRPAEKMSESPDNP